MVKNKVSQIWQTITIEDSDLNAQGLVAIEKCTDYSIANLHDKKPLGVKRSSNVGCHKSIKKKCRPSKTVVENKVLEDTPGEKEEEVEDSADIIQSFESWSKFGLSSSIIRALSVQGFKRPTQIQALTLPAAIFGCRDIVGAAETGSGKTLAFCLPILCGILKEKNLLTDVEDGKKPLYALILTPTRELAVQIKNHLVSIAKFVDVNVAVIVGGMATVKQERILSKGPEIVVATPGRLWELIQQSNPHLTQIGDIRYLAIDETDRMLEKGHFEELHNLLERVNADKTKMMKRQNFVFSATLTLVHELPKYLMKKTKRAMTSEQKLQKIINILGITDPKIVDVTNVGNTPESLIECRICCQIDEKDYYVYYFIQKHPGRTIIFCNSIGCVRRLSNLLKILGCPTLPIHASMQQRQRLKNLEKFRDEARGILVATDVAARGLDIPNIDHVLHYQTPRTSESYIHRSGRTARATRQGITVLLIEPAEMKNYMKLCKTLKRTENLPTFPIQDDYLQSVKRRVKLARELDKLELSVQKANAEEGWLQKAARDMDIIVDDFSNKYDRSSFSIQKRSAHVKRKELTSLLAKPIFPKGFSGKYPQFMAITDQEESAAEVIKNVVQKPTKILRKK